MNMKVSFQNVAADKSEGEHHLPTTIKQTQGESRFRRQMAVARLRFHSTAVFRLISNHPSSSTLSC